MDDLYHTIAKPISGALFKDKGSKFIGYAFPVTTESQISQYLEQVKKEHHKARHWCYAWRLGTTEHYRANDDGEPSGSAGLPIFGQIKSFDLTDILVIVVRYFGGVKLGVSGLINAYKTTAQIILEECQIINKTINQQFFLKFDYKDMDKILKIIRQYQANIVSQQMELDCQYIISIRQSQANILKQSLEDLRCLSIKNI